VVHIAGLGVARSKGKEKKNVLRDFGPWGWPNLRA